jgi:hypothetical protein
MICLWLRAPGSDGASTVDLVICSCSYLDRDGLRSGR